MKRSVIVTVLCTLACVARAQMKLGGSPADIRSDAVLDLGMMSKGLLLPRVSAAALNLSPLDTAANGMLLFNMTDNYLYIKKGTGFSGWKKVADAPAVPVNFIKTDLTVSDVVSFNNTTNAVAYTFPIGTVLNATDNIILNPRTNLPDGIAIAWVRVSDAAAREISIGFINTSGTGATIGTVTFDVTIIQL